MSDPTSRTRGTLRAAFAAGLAAILGVALLVAPTPASAAGAPVPETLERARDGAAHWIATDLIAHDHVLPSPYGGPDWGLTADAVLALAALGRAGDTARDTAQALRVAGATPYEFGGVGLKAKGALAMQVAGLDPTSIPTDAGPLDLIADLRASLLPSGQFRYANHFGQSLAVLALARTSEGVPVSAVTYLESLQCLDPADADLGGFGFQAANPCGSVDGDATGMITSALLGVAGTDGAVGAAVGWMTGRQRPDGSFAPQHSPGLGNTNSTGLVASAAYGVASPAALAVAARATDFVRGLQIDCASPIVAAAGPETGGGFLDSWRGAIAYSAATYGDGVTGGVAPHEVDGWRRATQQAVLGLGGPGLAALDLSRAEPGVPALPSCTPPTTPPTGPPTSPPAGPPTPTVSPTPIPPTTVAPPPRRLRVQAPGRVRAGAPFTLRITGLDARERVKIQLTGQRAKQRRASSGRVGLRLRAPRRTGTVRVRVVAPDTGRRAVLKIRVVRR